MFQRSWPHCSATTRSIYNRIAFESSLNDQWKPRIFLRLLFVERNILINCVPWSRSNGHKWTASHSFLSFHGYYDATLRYIVARWEILKTPMKPLSGLISHERCWKLYRKRASWEFNETCWPNEIRNSLDMVQVQFKYTIVVRICPTNCSRNELLI